MMPLLQSIKILAFVLCLSFALTVLRAPLSIAQDSAVPSDDQMTLGIKEDIGRCAEIIGRVDRLICFDDLATDLGFIPADQAEREEEVLETYGFWEVTKRRTAAGEEIIYLKNEAVEDITSKSGVTRKPVLVIKCKFGQTDVYLDWKSRLTSSYFYGGASNLEVVHQFDAYDREYGKWELSTDKNAIFVPDPIDFVKKMKHSGRLVIELTPPNDVMQTVVHDISGMNVVLDILVQKCYN